MPIFGKKKTKHVPSDDEEEEYSSESSSTDYRPGYPAYQQSIPRSSDASSKSGSTKKKKRGFRSKIKGLVRGGKSSKSEDNSVESGPTDDNSYDNDYNQPAAAQQTPPGRPSQLDPRILAQIENESSSSSDSSSDDEDFHQELRPVMEEDDEDGDESDNDFNNSTAGNNYVHRSQKLHPQLGPDSDDDNMAMLGMNGRDFLTETIKDEEPATLVILLLDPKSLRFELLQLQLDNRKGLKVKDVLGRLDESITEPALQPLKFVALVDRAGGVNKPEADLTKAMAHRKVKDKDILVGLSKDINVEELFRRVRPIFGDPNVGRMLDMNGFDTAGWAKKKEKESILEEKVKVVPVSKWASKLNVAAVIAVGFVVIVGAGIGITYFLGSREGGVGQSAAIQIQEAFQEAVEEMKDVVQEAVEEVKEAVQAVIVQIEEASPEIIPNETLHEAVSSATCFANATLVDSNSTDIVEL